MQISVAAQGGSWEFSLPFSLFFAVVCVSAFVSLKVPKTVMIRGYSRYSDYAE
jgi:hypothetical protein